MFRRGPSCLNHCILAGPNGGGGDLQVHTPFSALNNGFGQHFDHYAKTLFEKAIENKIAVIGVTDYFCIDGYKRLLALRDDVASLSALIGEDHAAAARSILLFRTSSCARR